MVTLHIRQDSPKDGLYPIRLTLKRAGQPDQEAEAKVQFALSQQEQEDLRWYLEDYLQRADTVEPVTVQQVETMIKARGEELYTKVLALNPDTQALWFSVRNDLADLRVEISAGIAEATSIPWELMRDPEMDSPISLRARSFVRVQSNPNMSFVPVPVAEGGRIRILYVICRPRGVEDVELRAVANRLLQGLGPDRTRFSIKVLRPPTFEQLQKELSDAKDAKHPYHVVHFDGHGVYADLSQSMLTDWAKALSSVTLGSEKKGKHGYVLFEHPSEEKMRPVDGQTLGQLLHDNGVPVLVLNACQSAMHEATAAPKAANDVHEEVRAIGSLAQAVVDQGIPAVLGMRYSVYVVTAAQYIGELYRALAKGRSFGQAATEGRKHLQLNPERWVGLQPWPLQDWLVPVVYEVAPIEFFPAGRPATLDDERELDPVQNNRTLLRHVPQEGFVGRDETLLALDRSFDTNRVVLLHAYAGQGKSSTAVEFARWYALTGGLGKQPFVFFSSFESHVSLDDLFDQVGQPLSVLLEPQGIDWIATNDPDRRRNLVLSMLRHVPVLWIWDNVEPVVGFPEGTESQWTDTEQNDLRDFLLQVKLDSASKVKVLLTSRRDEAKWLGGIPHSICMPRMSYSDAARLAITLGEKRHLNPSEIAEWQPLLDFCAGNPLTLRVLVGQALSANIRGKERIEQFVEDVRNGERQVEDADEKQGRDKSLGASLSYGFRTGFKDDELPVIALLHLFQRIVDVGILQVMGKNDDFALPELKDKSTEHLVGLLKRASDIGLLTPLSSTQLTIHPALPWFLRQLFTRCYDGRAGHSTAQAAVRAWVAVTGELGSACADLFEQGDRSFINVLESQEANLLQALRLARRNEWWPRAMACMQGLHCLYEYKGRISEWARLVREVCRDYVTVGHEPIPGRENEYSVAMSYLVDMVVRYEHDPGRAVGLQEKLVQWDIQQAAGALALPADASLNAKERNLLRSLGASLFMLGEIRLRQDDARCLEQFGGAIQISRRINDKTAEAIVEFNLGNIYKNLPEVRDFNAAEGTYRRALNLLAPNDSLGRSRCMMGIGSVYYERFRGAYLRGELPEAQRHARESRKWLLQSLQLCPREALPDLAAVHGELGNLYAVANQFDSAREHFEKAAGYFGKTSNYMSAGDTRRNMAVMYADAATQETQLSQRRAYLHSGLAYAEAALRDYRKYPGRAGEGEDKARELIQLIERELAKLPE